MNSKHHQTTSPFSRRHNISASNPVGPKPFQPMLSRKELDDLWTATLKDIFIAWSQRVTTTPSLPPQSSSSAEP